MGFWDVWLLTCMSLNFRNEAYHMHTSYSFWKAPTSPSLPKTSIPLYLLNSQNRICTQNFTKQLLPACSTGHVESTTSTLPAWLMENAPNVIHGNFAKKPESHLTNIRNTKGPITVHRQHAVVTLSPTSMSSHTIHTFASNTTVTSM